MPALVTAVSSVFEEAWRALEMWGWADVWVGADGSMGQVSLRCGLVALVKQHRDRDLAGQA